MEKWIALNNQIAGRDKLARIAQYCSRTVWDVLEKRESRPDVVDQFKTLEYLLSSFRKLLRFGKCLDVLYGSLKSIHYEDLVIRITLTLSKISQALFLLSDHIIWLSRTGLFKRVDSKKWTTISNKYWLLTIIINLARDAYEILRLLELYRFGTRINITRPVIGNNCDYRKLAILISNHMYYHKDLVIDTVKNLCDAFIPLTALGYTRLSPWMIGVLGVLSSSAGLIAILEPTAKLTPV